MCTLAVLLAVALICQFVLPKQPEQVIFAQNIFEPFFYRTTTDCAVAYRCGFNVPEELNIFVPRSTKTFRIMIVGGSAAYLLYKKQDYFVNLLTQVNPVFNYEILNCGVSGFDSTRTCMVAKEALEKCEPDLLIVLSGNNEIYYLSNTALYLRYLVGMLKKIRVMGYLLDFFADGKNSNRLPTPPPSQQVLENYKKNITDIVQSAQNVPVMLCTVPNNTKHTWPYGNKPTDSLFQDSLNAYYQNDQDNALRLCNQYLDKYPEEKFGLFLKASILRKQQKPEKAAELFKTVLDMDYPYNRACTQSNEILRQLSRQYKNAHLVDTQMLFESLGADCGLAGAEIFFDECHWYFEFSKAFFEQVANMAVHHQIVPNKGAADFMSGKTYDQYLNGDEIFNARTQIRIDPSIIDRNFPQLTYLNSISPSKLRKDFNRYQRENNEDPHRWAFYCLAMAKLSVIDNNPIRAQYYIKLLDGLRLRLPQLAKLQKQLSRKKQK